MTRWRTAAAVHVHAAKTNAGIRSSVLPCRAKFYVADHLCQSQMSILQLR